MKVEVRAMGKIEGYSMVSVLGNSIGGEVRGDGLAICRKLHPRNLRRVSAVVRTCQPFLNGESISTSSSAVLRDSLLSSV